MRAGKPSLRRLAHVPHWGRPVAALGIALSLLAACAPAGDRVPATDTAGVAVGSQAASDTTPAPGWRQVTGTDPANPWGASPDLVSRYLDDSLRYRPVATYWVQIPGPQPDSAQVRFEVVIGSDHLTDDAFASDGHVVARYVLESRNRAVPALGLSARDTLGYAYVLPERVQGQVPRFRARFAARTPNGGWRPANPRLVVTPGASRPPNVPDGPWLVWGEHGDASVLQNRDSLSRALLGRPYTSSLLDWCFACLADWCWVTEGDA